MLVLSLVVLLGFGGWAGYSAWRRGAALAHNGATDKAPRQENGAPRQKESAENTEPQTTQDEHHDVPADNGPHADDQAPGGTSETEPTTHLDGDRPEASTQEAPPEVLGLYSLRTAPKREELVAQLGGTPASETAVGMGLEWLARHQSEDGHWGPDGLGRSPNSRCEKQHVCEGPPGGPYEAALTGLALLALQAGGHYDFNEHPYSAHVAKGLNRLVVEQGKEGQLVGSQNRIDEPGIPDQYDQRFMYEHAIATFALAEACAVARASGRHPDAKFLEATIKAEKFIEDQQHRDGGWRYTVNPNDAGDTSVSGWVMLALKSCREAEIKVSDQTVQRMVRFFKNEEDPLTGRTHYQTPTFTTDALTGVGMLVDEFIVHQSDSPLCALAAPYLADTAESRWGQGNNQQHDYYLWYNCTLAMYQAGGEPWDRWNQVVRDRVQGLQVHGEGCDRGSWAPDDQWGGYGGRIYSTALATLTLEVYYRFAKDDGGEKNNEKGETDLQD